MTAKRTAGLVLGLILWAVALQGAEELVIADFEGETYGNWEVTGEAFGPGPARGTLPNQMPVDGFLGRGLVNSYYRGDGTTGTLTSPPFTLARAYVRFLIGGGKHPGRTCLNLLVDGRVVRTATGPNDRPGGSEHLDWQEWEVREFAGQTGVLEIVDQGTGGWGHINVDQIVQTDRRLPGLLTNVTREFVVGKRYLNLPVKNGAPKRQVTFLVDGQAVREFEIELSEAPPDWWAFLDMSAFLGKRAVLRVDQLREDSTALSSVEQSDAIKGAENLYREPLRPQFHFSSRRGWNNDPNGLVFYQGEYHLFYQHNPFGWGWGNMHWGHAVSRDLVRWQELDDALHPDERGTIFSGSAVVDWPNRAGLAAGTERALVCIYTAAGGTSRQSQGQPFTQCIASSTDRGRSWTKWRRNPVLPHLVGSNRDPKVIWYEPGKKWIMALYLDGSDFALFESLDLLSWRRLCEVKVPGTSECPEFFEIKIEGVGGGRRWIFYGGNGRYLIGQFDGQVFTPESGPHPLHFGNCFYASQTYHDIPPSDSRRILVAWGQINLPGMPFNQMMDCPVELTLHSTDDGLRLFSWPVRESESLRTNKLEWATLTLKPGENLLVDTGTELFDLVAELAVGSAVELGLSVRGVQVVYSPARAELSCLGQKGPLRPREGKIRLRLLVDRASIEIFGNDGHLYMPMGVLLDGQNRSLEAWAKGSSAVLDSLVVHQLRSAWRTD